LDSYKKTDKSYKFKTAIAELIIRYELNDFDFLEYRMKQVGKDFKDLLATKENEREKLLLEIISELIYTNSIRSNKELSAKITDFIDEDKIEDRLYSEMINYNNWLSKKL
jgi:hypothetical protein